jgi:acetoacetyl-CoA synthetase
VPAFIRQAPDIPRTISGKTVEIAVRNILHGRPVDNVDALANPGALAFFESIRSELGSES